MEALASATPLVTTPAGGITAVVEHGRTGLIVPERDVDALAESLAMLLADEPMRTRMGRLHGARCATTAPGRRTQSDWKAFTKAR